MYQEFRLEKTDFSILGYHWPAADADYVVCLIHGIGEYAARYERMASMMNGAGIAVVSMDLRGHGASAGARGHCAPRKAVLRDIDCLIEKAGALYPGIPLVLYGHSMGGNLVLDYRSRGALNHVPAGYVLSAPWVMLVKRIPFYLEGFVRAMLHFKPDFTISAGVDPAVLGNPQMLKESDSKSALTHNRISAATGVDGYDIADAILAGTHENNGGAAGKPLLLMHGDADKICYVEGSRRIAELEGDCCTYIEWPSYFHELHNGSAEADGSEVIRAAIDWIRRL